MSEMEGMMGVDDKAENDRWMFATTFEHGKLVIKEFTISRERGRTGNNAVGCFKGNHGVDSQDRFEDRAKNCNNWNRRTLRKMIHGNLDPDGMGRGVIRRRSG